MNSKELNRLKLILTLMILSQADENNFPEDKNPVKTSIDIKETDINDNHYISSH